MTTLLKGMLSSTAGLKKSMSLTLSVRGDDINDDEIDRATEFLHSMQAAQIAEDHICVAERGDQKNYFHLQIVISSDWSPSKAITEAEEGC